MRVLVTRPEEDAGGLVERIAALGHEAVHAPLIKIETRAGVEIDLAGAQAIVATSRNALRALATNPALDAALQLPLLAVGRATAAFAREMGFREVHTGPGDGSGLAETIRAMLNPAHGALLHISGETLAFDLAAALAPAGFTIRRAIVYRSTPADRLPPLVADRLRDSSLDAVTLMSPRTAETYARLVAEAGLVEAARGPAYICLSPAVAERLSPIAPGHVLTPPTPSTEEMLALLGDLAARSRPT